jgi:tRNA(adenine34) deaminase
MSETSDADLKFMKMALREAMNAYDAHEVPIGCVIVCKGQVIARGYNLTERLHDFTAHAEMQAYTAASEYLGGKSLHECTLYVTLEPCVMCAGGAYNTRVGRIVFGAYDEKRGYTKFGDHMDNGQGILHPKTEVTGGVMEAECAGLLRQFFEERREK